MSQKVDWASWSTRRVIVVGVLYGVSVGGIVGVAQALFFSDTLSDAIDLVALHVLLWSIAAPFVLFVTRWVARHPRRPSDHPRRDDRA